MISKRHFFIGTLFGVVLLITYLFSLPDGKLHIVFCDVGQGDAAYIRAPDGSDMLIDGGPNDEVLTCLGRHMPFFDRTIDLVVLSHPQKDHMQGLISVLDRYNVTYFVTPPVGNESEGFRKLEQEIKKRGIAVRNLYQGDQFSLDKVLVRVLWPERNWAAEKTGENSSLVSAGSNVLGLSAGSEDLNSFSGYYHVTFGDFDALFTGDGDIKIQPEIMAAIQLPDVELLKFPHHGSKTGIMEEFLDKVNPEAAVISVGKNPWGHPTKEALGLLEKENVRVFRTDLTGDVEVVSDGNSWTVN